MKNKLFGDTNQQELEVGDETKKSDVNLTPKSREFKQLFLLNGSPIKSLLDIPVDTQVLIVSQKDKFLGVEFEDVAIRERILNKTSHLHSLVAKRLSGVDSLQSSQTFEPHTTSKRVNKALFSSTAGSLKLPEIVSIKDKLRM